MATTRIPIPVPSTHAGQRAVMKQARRFNWLAAGRRWRKTSLCMRIAITAAIDHGEILWGAPTYDQVRVGWDEAKRSVREWATFNEGRMECHFPGGGVIRYRSLDNPDNARGHTADGVVIDEAAFCVPSAWHEVLRPMLMDTGGWAWMIFTPNGRNWVWREWEGASDEKNPEAIAWQAPALGVAVRNGVLVRSLHPLENPEIPFSELLQLYQSMPERSFRQEILAEFIEDGGGVFRGVRDACTAPVGTGRNFRHGYAVGIDWGRTNDFTVFSVWDTTDKRQVHMDRVTGLDFVSQGNRLVALCEYWQPDAILAEANSIGKPMIEYLQRENLPIRGFDTTNASKLKLIDAYALGFERQAFTLLDEPQQIREHEAYEQETLPGGSIRFTAPEGEHDDTVIANALAWSLAKNCGDDERPEPEPPVDDRMVADLPGMTKFFHTKEKKGRWG